MKPLFQPSRRTILSGLSSLPLLANAAGQEPIPQTGHLEEVKPADLGLDSARLQKAFDLLTQWTTGPNAPVPGACIMVGRNGKATAPRFFGRLGPEPDAEPLREDAMFYMASVTKPIIYTCGMILVERGLLNLNSPVNRYIPEFTGKNKESTQVLHLFTHTSGLADELPNNTELRKQHAPLSKFVSEAAKSEAFFKPGTSQSYSSLATILVAEIVQRISGLTIREFVNKEIVRPLGLKSTGLGSQGFDRKRIARCTLPEYQMGGNFGWNSKYWQEFGSPAGGLFSTARDYAVICAMMLDSGKWKNQQFLSPATVRMMTSNRMDDMPEMPESIRRTQPWGLGWKLNHLGQSDSWSDLLDRNVFGHTGSSGNVVWMNPKTRGFCLIFSNYLRSRAPWRLVSISNIVASAFI